MFPLFLSEALAVSDWLLMSCFHDGEAAEELSEDKAPAVAEGMLYVCSRMGVSRIARMHVCTRTLRCYFSLQSSSTDLGYNAILNCVFLRRKCL